LRLAHLVKVTGYEMDKFDFQQRESFYFSLIFILSMYLKCKLAVNLPDNCLADRKQKGVNIVTPCHPSSIV
jgi:hypothetical protein